jgi:hypothetical protein
MNKQLPTVRRELVDAGIICNGSPLQDGIGIKLVDVSR